MSADDYNYDNKAIADIILEEMENVKFLGISVTYSSKFSLFSFPLLKGVCKLRGLERWGIWSRTAAFSCVEHISVSLGKEKLINDFLTLGDAR